MLKITQCNTNPTLLFRAQNQVTFELIDTTCEDITQYKIQRLILKEKTEKMCLIIQYINFVYTYMCLCVKTDN